ncbi:LA_2272 family surface repeat-containing protein [Sorangium sp. So ce1024]|uniref:LA_2272 family surface repeat-containing protein n=1 Tax=Sorangium sp. So ce1024 TaxID=3133327 RepID=UPI003EFFF6BE
MNTPDTALPITPPGRRPRAHRKVPTRGAVLGAGVLLLRAIAAAGVFAAASALPASALAAEPSAAGVELVVDGVSWTLDPEAVRAAVGRELGGPVTVVGAANAGRPTLVLRGEPDGRVTLTYSAGDGRHIGRTIDVPEDPDRAAEAIALLAGNLVRDEAAELAAALSKRPSEEPAAAPPAPAAPPAAPAAPPAARAAQPARPAPPEPPPCVLPGAKAVLVGGDVVPFVGTSTVDGTNVVRRYSLNLVAGYTAGVSGVELGAGVNVLTSFLCGTQISSAANLVLGPARGAQVTGGLNLATSLRGAQLGSLNLVTGPVAGVQGGVLNVAAGAVDGAQLGVANVALGASTDVQVGLANVAVSASTDVQVGLANVAAGESADVHVGLANVAAGASNDVQIGLANVAAGESTGVQIGLLNVSTGAVRGAQIGLVNYADASPFSLGLFNIIRDGRLHIDAWGTESGLAMAGIKHGSDHFHNIYGIGVRVFGDRPLIAYTLGLGGRISLGERAYADLDVLGYSLNEPTSFRPVAVLTQARALLGFRLLPGFAIFGGPSYNVAFGDTPEDARLSPYGSIPLRINDSETQRAWPGVVLGVQAL